jgi:hypothetical protein
MQTCEFISSGKLGCRLPTFTELEVHIVTSLKHERTQ